MVHCPGGNATDPIWRVLASSDRISSWTPLKPQHSSPNSNPNPLANQLGCSDFLTPPIPLILDWQTPSLPWISYATQKLMLNSCKLLQKQSEALHMILWHFCPSLKHHFIAYRTSKMSSRPDCIFEIHQQWQSDFNRVYSNSCCSCSFEAEIRKIGQSSNKLYSNYIVNFQEFTKILNASKKRLETHWIRHVLVILFDFVQFYSRVSRDSKVHNSTSSLFCGWLLFGLFVRLLDLFVSQNLWGVCVAHSPGRILGYTYILCSYAYISISISSYYKLVPHNNVIGSVWFGFFVWWHINLHDKFKAEATPSRRTVVILFKYYLEKLYIYAPLPP